MSSKTWLIHVAIVLAMVPKIAAGAELELTDLVRIYGPINAIGLSCGFAVKDNSANWKMLEDVKSNQFAREMLAREHWRTQAEYRAAIDKPAFCYKFFKDMGGFVEPSRTDRGRWLRCRISQFSTGKNCALLWD
jgi:hypothetical protein